MTLQEHKEKIIELIKELNRHQTYENLGKVESYIDFYSDCYKDEYNVRPRADIAYFRSLYSEGSKTLLVFFDELPFERQIAYLQGRH